MLPRRAGPPAAAARPAVPRTALFISYSRRDEAAVVRLAEALETDPALQVFRDKNDILPAEAWSDRLGALILKADAIVLCVSPEAMRSPVVAWEIDSAIAANKRIVPVVVRETPPETLPAPVAKLNLIFLREQDAFEPGVAQVRAAVQTDIGWVREHTRIGDLARRWAGDGRRAADALRGPALELAERWLSLQPRQAPDATDVHRDFISASRRGATRRQQGWIVGSAVVAALSIGLSILAYRQRNKAIAQRTEANAQRLVAEAQAVLADATAPGAQATRMLLASLGLRASDEARRALKAGVDRLEPLPVAALPWPATAHALTCGLRFSPDGAWLTAATGSAWLIWSTTTHELRIHHAADLGESPGKIVFAPDGRYAAMLAGGKGPGGSAQRVLLADLARAAVTEVRFGQVMDLAALGERLLALVAGRSGQRVRAIALPSGKAVWQQALPHRVRLGRLVRRSADAAAAAAAPPDLVSMLTQGAPRLEDIVLAEDDGRISLWQLDRPEPLQVLALPSEAAVLAIGELGRVMAVRMANASLAVLDARSGEAQWRGAPIGEGGTIRFTGGDRFVTLPGQRGVRLQSLAGGVDVELEDARRSDWDAAAIGHVERYSAIIEAGSSDDGAVLATAWKDGRIDVWRPGLKPRYGTGFAALPVSNFETVARFDHGAELGPTATWAAPPALFVSPSGRFVASQGMGLRTNPVGGPVSAEPMVRIWDTWRGAETARFQRPGAMGLAFSPRDDLLASSYVPAGGAAPSPRIELWRLSRPQPEWQCEESMVELPMSAPSGIGIPARPNAPLTVGGAETVWVGADRRLRLLDPRTGRVHVLDDLGPAAREAFGDNRQAVQALLADADAACREACGGADAGGDPYERFAPALAGRPAEMPVPLYPVAVSADRRRAVVKLGATLRFYALDTHRFLHAERIEDAVVLGAMGVPFPEHLLLSQGGETVALTQVTRGDVQALFRTLRAAGERRESASAAPRPILLGHHVLLGAVDRRVGLASIEQTLELSPASGSPVAQSGTLVAVSDDGRLLVQERQRLAAADGQPPVIESRFAVVDVRSRAVRFETPSWTTPLDPLEAATAGSRTAALSPSGLRLLVDETGPACPPRLAITPALLPVRVPSGPKLRTTLTLWDLSTGKVLHEAVRERTPLKAPRSGAPLPGGDPGAWAAMSRSRPSSIGMADETTAVRTVIDLLPSAQWERVDLRVATERIPLERVGSLSDAARARLPDGMREVSAAEWARWAPGEKPRAVGEGQR